MSTASQVIDRVVKGFRRNAAPDLLVQPLTASASDDNVHYLGLLAGMGVGTNIEIGEELMLVKENDPINHIAVVRRGWLGTTIAAHAADDPIFIEPRITRSDVLALFNDCLHDMYGRDLYAVDVEELVYEPGSIGYAIPAETIKVLRVDVLEDSFSKYWKPISDWYMVPKADEAFATGKALMVRVSLPFGAFIRVTISTPFTPLASESQDLLAIAGLPVYMEDLLFYFSMNRLMIDLERERSQIEAAHNHQRAQDVPPFLALRTGEWYQARYDDRVETARKRLKDEVKATISTGYGS